MSEVVNKASSSQLSQRLSEPTHIGGTPKTDIGGEHDGKVGTEAGKIDAASGISTDTTIPKSVGAEASHLSGTSTPVVEGEVDVEFDGDAKNEDVDDLDKALDEAIDDKDIDVEVKESEEDDEDDDKKNPFVKEEFPWQKKDGDDDKDKDDDKKDDKKVDENVGPEASHLSGTKTPVVEGEDDKDDDKLEESVKVSIKLPKMQSQLFESAGFSATQQKQVTALFESAIKSTTKQVSTQLNEAYKARTARKVALIEKKLASRLDTYLSVVVEQWVEENKVALVANTRAELAEEFLNGLQKLFTESYIDVPESKVDIVETLTGEVETLKKKLNEQHTSNLKLRRLAESANKARIVAQFARNMSEAQAAKLAKLAEDTQYINATDFRGKLTMLKESYFAQKKSADNTITRLPEENVEVITEETKTVVKNEIERLADQIGKHTSQRNW